MIALRHATLTVMKIKKRLIHVMSVKAEDALSEQSDQKIRERLSAELTRNERNALLQYSPSNYIRILTYLSRSIKCPYKDNQFGFSHREEARSSHKAHRRSRR